uniref:Fibronectin type-III domain-containing protein n=1 Tax=Ditylenchus dipsaci TaxID=166011 RepID=A0A915DBN4_9BILA
MTVICDAHLVADGDFNAFAPAFLRNPPLAQINKPRVQNLRAKYDSRSDSILLEWDTEHSNQGADYLIRYKITSTPEHGQWKFARGYRAANMAKLDATSLRNGDELLVQAKLDDPSATEWSDPLMISIAKRVQIGELVVDEADLLPPLNFTANVLDPKTVRLDWSVSPSTHTSASLSANVYYIVNVKQLTSDSGENLVNKQIKIEANNFLLGNLVPGERYEMTIRAATGPDHVSSTAAIVEISMPKEDEYFEVGNLIISSRFKADGRGVVNLTWEVPAALVGKIRSYDVQYAPSHSSSGRWQQILFSGDSPTAILHDLRSDTEYVLKIKTILQNNVQTESGDFRFRTPKVAVNPLSKVDVIYSSETSAVRIQWILAPHISLNHVAGYDAPSIYRFTTIDSLPLNRQESRLPNALAYRNVGPGRVVISWSYSSSITDSVAGAAIFYTDQVQDPNVERWQRVNVENTIQQSVVLIGLRENTVYAIQIVPVLYSGELDFPSAEKFQLKTDSML